MSYSGNNPRWFCYHFSFGNLNKKLRAPSARPIPAMNHVTLRVVAAMLATCLLLQLLADVTAQDDDVTRRPRRNRERGGRRNRNRNRNRNRESNGSSRRGGRGNRDDGRCGRTRGVPAGVEEVQVPMCRGLLPYCHTKLPNRFNHTTQAQVYRRLEHMWHYMDHGCSRNMRLLICSLYLPKWVRRGPAQGPCKSLCNKAKQKCKTPLEDTFRLTWSDHFNCNELPEGRCIKPWAMNKKKRLDPPCPDPYPYPACRSNRVMPVCANVSFTWGTFPNMFEQCHVSDINTELQWYAPLQATGCDADLNFLLCGVYSPFCINGEEPFTFPCAELCNRVRANCEGHYTRLYNGLPWPNKLQCHRYPLSTMTDRTCVMPSEGSTFGADNAPSR